MGNDVSVGTVIDPGGVNIKVGNDGNKGVIDPLFLLQVRKDGSREAVGADDHIRVVIIDGLLQLAGHQAVGNIIDVNDGMDLVGFLIKLPPSFWIELQDVEIAVQDNLVQYRANKVDRIDDLDSGMVMGMDQLISHGLSDLVMSVTDGD